eukprot:1923507-Prymnesium_polylepis.1
MGDATHFKSAKQLHYWSKRKAEVEFLRMLWIEFGCPGHGKLPSTQFKPTPSASVRLAPSASRW